HCQTAALRKRRRAPTAPGSLDHPPSRSAARPPAGRRCGFHVLARTWRGGCAFVSRTLDHGQRRIAHELRVRRRPETAPELAPPRVPLHARVAALGAEPDVRPLHVAPARNSAYSTIARSAAT